MIPNQFKTLFIQSENSLLGIRKRLGLIFKGNEAYKKARRCLIFPGINGDCRVSGNATDSYFQDFLREMIYATDAKVFVVDPLISFHHANENDNAEMRKYLDTLMSICIETQTSLILIHHVGKASSGAVGGGRGASSIGDWADNVLSLEPGKDNILKVSHSKGRYFSEHPQFCLERTGSLDFTRVTPQFDDEGELVKEALDALGGEAKTQDMLAKKMVEMGCSSKPKAIRLVGRAEKAEVIEKVRQGKAMVIKLKED